MNGTSDDVIVRVDQQLRAAMDLPVPDIGFAEQLRDQLNSEAKTIQTQLVPRRHRLGHQWAFALGAAIVIVAILAVSTSTVMVAMKQRVVGYIAGLGLVKEDPKLRVLGEPVSLTRDGITITVQQALLYQDRTVLNYEAASSADFPFAEPGASGDICLEYARLQLPDGTILMPEPMGDGKTNRSGYQFATSFSASVPSDVKHATLIIPCLLDTPRGAAPEDWSFALTFVPAPPDMDLSNVHTAADSPSVTDQGITMQLENVVVQGDDFIFGFYLNWNREEDVNPDLYPLAIHLIDATGRQIPLVDDSGRPPISRDSATPLMYRTNDVPVPGPMSIHLTKIMTTLPADDNVSFTFDPGDNPKPGQVWTLDEHVTLAEYAWTVRSAEMLAEDGRVGFAFTMQADDPGTVMAVDLFDRQHPIFPGVPGTAGETFTSGFYYEDGVPDGPITVTVGRVTTHIDGDWQIQWMPPEE
jgi:hypothetical protein